MNIELDMHFEIMPHLGVETMDGQALIVDFSQNLCFGLNELGLEIWSMIKAHYSVSEIIRALVQKYRLSSEIIERDVRDFLEALWQRALIQPAT